MKHIYSITYGFTQRFSFPAKAVYDWCVDYKPSDLSLMKEEGTRRIRRISKDALILDEVTYPQGNRVRKIKLVRLNDDDLSYTNTHIGGPFRHSQFIYRIIPEGKNGSRLHFRGLLLYPSSKKLSSRAVAKIRKDELRGDAQGWRHLAKAMAGALQKSSRH
jgi:hypothetical protein